MLEPTAATRVAIEFLTLWLEPGAEARVRAAELIYRVLHEHEAESVDSVVAGHLNLSMVLLFMLAKERGATGEDMIAVSRKIIREISRDLPE